MNTFNKLGVAAGIIAGYISFYRLGKLSTELKYRKALSEAYEAVEKRLRERGDNNDAVQTEAVQG